MNVKPLGGPTYCEIIVSSWIGNKAHALYDLGHVLLAFLPPGSFSLSNHQVLAISLRFRLPVVISRPIRLRNNFPPRPFVYRDRNRSIESNRFLGHLVGSSPTKYNFGNSIPKARISYGFLFACHSLANILHVTLSTAYS